MDQQRWAQIEELLQRALDLEPGERASFLERACDGDEELRSSVTDLLNKEADARSFMESPAVACIGIQVGQPSPTLPSQIGRYHIDARIGAGGMGQVYQARDEILGRVVALKLLPPEFTFDPERVRRFEQEAFAASQLNHPNIITIFEITHVDGSHFIVEELVEGQTLRELLTDQETGQPRKLGLREALELTIQIAAALKTAHTAWIIHRDIKPENIMVRTDGLVKVLDFGIAKLSQDGYGETQTRRRDKENVASAPSSLTDAPSPAGPASVSSNQLTIPGTIMGTASYMSPEQARGEPLDGRTDLFSLGLLLYEMVTGARLFAGATRVQAIHEIERVDEALTRNLRLGQAPKELQRIIRKALRADRDERYASAGDLLDDLNRLKRRLESRSARRIIGLSGLAVAAALALAVLAAFLSVNEVWEEKILRDGHTAAVRRAVFSPDGRLLVSVGEDNQVIVWDFARRQRLKTLTDHTNTVNAVSFSPDGKWFATGSDDQRVIVWDSARLEKAMVLEGHRGPVRCLTFSPYGDLLASGQPGLTILWDTNAWKKLREFPYGYNHGNFIFLNNNHWLVDVSGRTWDLSSGEKVREEDPEWAGNWVAASPNGKLWAAVDPKGVVKFVDLVRKQSLASTPMHHDHGRSLAFSPDGRWLATAAERVVLWDAQTLAKIVPLEYESIVWSVAFSPDGRWLVSTHGDGAILVWDVAERELVANLREHSGGVRAVALSSDGKRIATASEDKSVIIWDVESGRKEAVLAGHQTRASAVAFSPDGNWLVSGDQAGNIIRWDLAQRVPVLTIKPATGLSNYYLAISPGGHFMATSSAVYDSETGHALVTAQTTPWHNVYWAAFSADGQLLIGATDEGEVLVIDTEKWQVIERQKWSNTAIVSLSLSPDGQYLVTGEDGKAVRWGTVRPLRQLAVIGEHEARVKSVAFSPDGKHVASAGDDKMIALWDVSRRKLITTIGTHTSPVISIAFSPDGRQLVSGEHDRSVRVYTRRRKLWEFHLD